jgi:hypothetical protein
VFSSSRRGSSPAGRIETLSALGVVVQSGSRREVVGDNPAAVTSDDDPTVS